MPPGGRHVIRLPKHAVQVLHHQHVGVLV
jgi:hypothetical protein